MFVFHSFVCLLTHLLSMFFYFFFFKQKTAYEMRISDWSSDVCSSDLSVVADIDTLGGRNTRPQRPPEVRIGQCRPGGWRQEAGGGRGRDPGLAPIRLLKQAHGVCSHASFLVASILVICLVGVRP